MADRSVKRPIGILHDVLVKVADFIFPADLVILDSEVHFDVPIILGRSFLATGRVLVDLELNELKYRLNGKEVSFEVCKSMKQQKEMSVFSIIDVFYEDERDVPVKDRPAVEIIAGLVELASKDVSDFKVVGLGIKHCLDPTNEVQMVSSMYLDEV